MTHIKQSDKVVKIFHPLDTKQAEALFFLLTQGFRYNESGVGWEMRFIGGTRSRRVL